MNFFMKKKKKNACVRSFRPEQVPQTNVDDAGSLLIYPKAAWKHQPLVNKRKASEALCRPDSLEELLAGLISSNDAIRDFVPSLFAFPSTLVVPDADLSTAQAKKC